MKEYTADILILYETVIILVFWYQQWLVGDAPFYLKFALKLTYPSEKCRLQRISAYNVSTARVSEKCSIIANRKSTTRFPTSYSRSAYVTPNSTKEWLKKVNLSFLWIKFKFNWIKSATMFLCMKTSSGKVVTEPFPIARCIYVGGKRNP